MGIRLWQRVRKEGGFGLVELMVAMVILNVAILALVAAFISSSTALARASRSATAATLAERQLELYRALTYTAIALDTTSVNATDTTYRNDTALPSNNIANLITTSSGCSGVPDQCNPSRTATGPDGETYRVDTYIVSKTPPNGRAIKLVTVVIRNGTTLTQNPWARQSSSFDQSTGE